MQECLICLDNLFVASYLKLNCTHNYHRACWTEWEFSENTRIALCASVASNSSAIRCPLCKSVVNQSDVVCVQAYDRKNIIARVKKFFRPKTAMVESSK
jgi:hypothetical protein